MVEGWCWLAVATENNGWLQFNGVQRSGDGFVKQESKWLTEN